MLWVAHVFFYLWDVWSFGVICFGSGADVFTNMLAHFNGNVCDLCCVLLVVLQSKEKCKVFGHWEWAIGGRTA